MLYRTQRNRCPRVSPATGQAGNSASTVVPLRQKWDDAVFWSPENPRLYDFVAELYEGNTLLDRYTSRFGFREMWVEGRNFVFNGRITRMHAFLYDHGAPLYMCRRDFLRAYFKALKDDLNYNAARFFNIVPEICLKVTNELGFLVAEGSVITSMELHRRLNWPQSNSRMETEFGEWIRIHRNYFSIVIWETDNDNWMVGFSLAKEGREWSGEYFRWLTVFGFSMEDLERDVEIYFAWLTSLDGWINKHDDTIIITHSGAMLELGKGEIILCQLDIDTDRYADNYVGAAEPHDILRAQALNVADCIFVNLGVDRSD